MRAMIDKENWVRCGECGHKLVRIVNVENDAEKIVLETKCHSCKALNIITGLKSKD